MTLEKQLEDNLLSAFATPELSSWQFVTSRQSEQSDYYESDEALGVIAIKVAYRQHDNFSLSPVSIPVTVSINTRIELDPDSTWHEQAVQAITDTLADWHRFPNHMDEALNNSAENLYYAGELRITGGTGRVLNKEMGVFTDDISFIIRGAEKFPVPPETRTIVTYKDGSVQKLQLSGELVRHQIPNWSNAVSVEIGQDITSIANAALFQGDNLESIVVPDTVTSIGDSAFAYNTKLTSVTLGQNVTSLGDRFIEYSDLTSLSIPKSVTTISTYALTTGDSKFRDITFEGRTIAEVQAMPNYSWRLWRPQVIHCTDGDITW